MIVAYDLKFYEKLGGHAFLEAAKDKMRRVYDYVLIDSRTGVSDTSGICTIQMPDVVVLCFTLNTQSIEGAVAVAESIDQQRREGSQKTIRIFPVSGHQSRTVVSWLLLASVLPSGAKAMHSRSPVWPFNSRTSLPVPGSQMRIV